MEPHPAHKTEVRVYSGMEALSTAAGELFTETARTSAAVRGRFAVALSGGRTPLPTYRLLSQPPYSELVPWDKTHVFWGDERCVPPDDPRNNAATALDELLNHVLIPANQIHRIVCEASPREAADRYEAVLRNFFQDRGPRFDLIFLGIGEDGHTASLFPGSPALDEQERWVKEAYQPEQRMHRVTLTAVAINAASRIAFLVQGRDKSTILQKIFANAGAPERLPAQHIRPNRGELIWLIDEEAASGLKRTGLQGAENLIPFRFPRS